MNPRSHDATPCADCGAPLGGRAGCEAAWHELGIRAAQDPQVVRTRAMHDAWCLQHPEPYVRSLKSFYVHFLALCVAIDLPRDPRAHAAIWHDIRMPSGIARPPPPTRLPDVTVADVVARPDEGTGERYVRAEWTRWAHAHETARAWLKEALDLRRRA